MKDPYLYPKLRWPLELSLEKLEGREILLLRDPLGISETPLCLVPQTAPLLACFEGSMSIDEIVEKYKTIGATGQLVEELVQILDKNLYLSTPGFFEAEKRMKDLYLNTPVRPAALAGAGYYSNSKRLEEYLDNFLSTGDELTKPGQGSMLGLVSPHIDYRRGGPCYGVTYSYLRHEQPDLYILIGTSHQYSEGLFHLTRKHFDSPLGQLGCDTDFVSGLARRFGEERSFAGEMLHKNEHSLELQVPFLKRMHAISENGMPRQEPEIVPILVGSFHEMYGGGKRPEEFEEYESFASALTEGVSERIKQGQKVCFVAGVDMAHMGRSFGDSESLSPEGMKAIELRDREYLDAIENQDLEALFAHVAEDNNARKICGFPSIYTMMDTFQRLGLSYDAHTFDYSQAVDYERDCAVTFAGVGLYDRSV